MSDKRESQSTRLKSMLQETKFGVKRGQIELISKATGFTRTAVGRWLNNDALPRTPNERIKVSQQLGVELIYWEYGDNFPSLNNGRINDASIYKAIFEVVDKKNYHDKVTEKDMDNIKAIVTCANNQSFFKDLVELVDLIIDSSVHKSNIKKD